MSDKEQVYNLIIKHCEGSKTEPKAIGYIEMFKQLDIEAERLRDILRELTTDGEAGFYKGINDVYFYS